MPSCGGIGSWSCSSIIVYWINRNFSEKELNQHAVHNMPVNLQEDTRCQTKPTWLLICKIITFINAWILSNFPLFRLLIWDSSCYTASFENQKQLVIHEHYSQNWTHSAHFLVTSVMTSIYCCQTAFQHQIALFLLNADSSSLSFLYPNKTLLYSWYLLCTGRCFGMLH